MDTKIKTAKATYAWKAFTSGFGVKPAPDDTYCAWCNKSQVQILNEHIEAHDREDKK